MLVLSRKQNEEIVIGDNVRITVVSLAGNRVRLGISAPMQIPVRRAELELRGSDAFASERRTEADGIVDMTGQLLEFQL